MTRPPLLGVNIDHAATLRQARYRGMHASPHAEPSPLAFARERSEEHTSELQSH